MKFPSSAAAVLPLVALALAVPTQPVGVQIRDITPEEIHARLNTSPADTKDTLTKRTPGNVFFCTGPNFTNTCKVLTFPLEGQNPASCLKIPEPWFESVGSIGPDPGALCFLSMTSTCGSLNSLNIAHPGNTDLYNVDGVDWGHTAQFFQCEQCTGCN